MVITHVFMVMAIVEGANGGMTLSSSAGAKNILESVGATYVDSSGAIAGDDIASSLKHCVILGKETIPGLDVKSWPIVVELNGTVVSIE